MDSAHQKTMDRVYGRMKYVYDATRPLFLAGRRQLRSSVAAPQGGRVLEVGCGTGRNLIVLAQRRPDVSFTGVDISTEMLAYAKVQIRRRALARQIQLFEGELDDFLLANGPPPLFDSVIFSYSLSMIPDWERVLQSSIGLLKPETGKLIIADFGACEAWPGIAARRLYKNLSYFHVTPRASLEHVLRSGRLGCGLEIRATHLWGGYAQIVEVMRRSCGGPFDAPTGAAES